MFIDARSLPDRSGLNCDLCIIGGGAAGITMAMEFIATGVEVILLESGGFELEENTQALYRGDDVGLPYFDLEYARLRYFGGTTNHWGGMCRSLEPIDFETRDWVAHSGWPITFNEFASYLPRAGKLCEIPPDTYSSDNGGKYISKLSGRDFISDKNDLSKFDKLFVPGVFHISPPTRFGETYRADLEKSNNIKVLLNANVTSIDTETNQNIVDQISVKTMTGKNMKVRPKQVVLATGGVENARILLSSNQTHKQGLGNEHDLVGRFFADHIELESGYILSGQHSDFFKLFAILYKELFFSLDVTPEIQRNKKLLNLGITLSMVPNQSRTQDSVSAARRLKKSFGRGKWPNNFFSDVGASIMGIDDVISYMRTVHSSKQKGLYAIMNKVETQPNPNSRVTLSDVKDALGIPRVKLNWQLSDLDYYSIYEMQKMLAQQLGISGFGRVNIELSEKNDEWPDATQGAHHHMGTTRMSHNKQTGVVDKNCKVFGLENLYIAGSSVFPTYGKANPTLNLIALTLRLADHLKTKMGAKGWA